MGTWHALQFHAGMTDTGVRHLERQGFLPFVPKLRDGGTIFPGYGFLELDLYEERWRTVNGTRGVIKLLPTHLEEPLALPAGFVEDLRDSLDDFNTCTESVSGWMKGDEVQVECGPFTGCVGELVRHRRGSLVLILSLLGRPCEVSVPKQQCGSPPAARFYLSERNRSRRRSGAVASAA